MSGFPTRFLRSILGPIFRDPRPVEHPEKELSAEGANLIANVCTAANLIMPGAVLIADTTNPNTANSAAVILHQEEAWNVDHAQAHPVLTYSPSNPGVYVYTFARKYLDKDGTDIERDGIDVELAGAKATAVMVAGSTPIKATVDLTSTTNTYVVTVTIRPTAGGDPIDGRFWLDVFSNA